MGMARERGARKLILQMGVSLDGIIAGSRSDRSTPVMEGEWGLPFEDPRTFSSASVHVYRRSA
jgi:hypothetical protein